MVPLVAVGGSAGGLEPLRTIVQRVPAGFSAALLVVLHTAPDGPSRLPWILARSGVLPAMHPVDGQAIESGHIYVAPPDHHLTIENGRMQVHRGPRFNGHRPSIDALFQSAAVSGHDVVGVLLSGMGSDGTLGLKAIRDAGGHTIVQSPDDAAFPDLVQRAITVVAPDFVLPSHDIARALKRMVTAQREDAADDKPLMGNEEDEDIEDSGRVPTPYSCPECGGVLWESPGPKDLGYKCRVGHAFSTDGLLSEQTEGIEKALWMGLRALEEKMSLLHRLANDTESRGLSQAADRFKEAAANLHEPAGNLRRLLEDNDLYQLPRGERTPSRL